MRIPSRRSFAVTGSIASIALIVACTSGAVNTGEGSGSVAAASSLNQNNPPAPYGVEGTSADISIPAGDCVYLIWNGANNSTRGFAYAAMPGTDYHYGVNLDLWSVPACGKMARDYIVGTGINKNALGETVGDRQMPAPLDGPAYTQDKTPVYVTLRMDWNLNQNETALGEFWQGICTKFNCATKVTDPNNPPTLGATSSTDGWNRWLAELVGPTLDQLVSQYMQNYSSQIITSYTLQQQLAQDISKAFSDAFVNITGQPDPLLCGPGTSHWVDIHTDNYYCSPVRITVSHVIPASQLDFGTFGANARNVAAAKAKMEECKALGLTTCAIGDNNGSVVISTKAKVTGNWRDYATAA